MQPAFEQLARQFQLGKKFRLVAGGKVALLGCTVTPGFDFADYRRAGYAELASKWPEQAERRRLVHCR